MIVLVIGAHPDDETYAGGAIARYAEQGHAVYLLMTTRGEGGSTGDPPVCEQDELGAVREQEARAAGAILGVRDVLFLPYRDPVPINGSPQAADVSLEDFSAAIQGVLANLRPDVVITHGSSGEYRHPQHILTHQAVLHALRSRYPEKPQQVWTWCASYPDPELPAETNWDDPADWLLDIRSWVDRKWQALRAHRSQVEAIARFLSARNSPIMSEKVESFHFLPDLSAGFPSDQ